MKHSELRAAMTAAFGIRAESVASDLVLRELDGRTAEQALAEGERPVVVWNAICDAQELGDHLRWHHRRRPEKPR